MVDIAVVRVLIYNTPHQKQNPVGPLLAVKRVHGLNACRRCEQKTPANIDECGLPFVSACCTGTSGAPKTDVQFHGSLSTYVKRYSEYSVMLHNDTSFDGKARPSMQHVKTKCHSRWQHRVLCSSHIGVGCTYHSPFIIPQPQIPRCYWRDVSYVSAYLPEYSVRIEVVFV